MEEESRERRPCHFTKVFPGIHLDVDVVDVPLDVPYISKLDIFLLTCSIVMHIVDMCFDYNIAIRYYLGGKITYFAWTMCLILIPSLINVAISRKMQHHDKKMNSDMDTLNDRKTTRLLIKNKLYCVIAVVLQLAPVIHYWETLKYALKARKCEKSGDHANEKRYYLKMLKEDQDVALLRVFECFLEAAPQQILQLTLMLKHYHNDINLELARILSLGVIASIWPLYTIICCIIHWTIMTIWILIDCHGILEFCRTDGHPPHMRSTFKERIYSILFAQVIGIVHIFIYLNTVDTNTFWKHLCFYTLCFVENITSNLMWRFTSPSEVKEAWYFNVFFIICIISFFIGITAMIVYYAMYHPSKKQRVTDPSLQPM
ncbi:hypothetical protein P5V15_001898 [Pogonomyrmex californicus]